jgi:hypothetical protein
MPPETDGELSGRTQRRDGGERPAYHFKALRAIEQLLSGRQPIDVPGALMVARHALKVCPSCGGELSVQRFSAHDSFVGLDTSVKYCTECEWEGEPE